MMKAKIAGVVMLYHPSGSVIQNIRTYLPDVGVLYLWDNSPGFCTPVVDLLKSLGRVQYLTEGKNVGISRALNVAAKKAMGEKYDYLLTMDQDSYACEGMISTMLYVAARDSSVGLITPYHLDRNAPSKPPDQDVDYVVHAMTSGNLVRLASFEKIGGFLEKLFIDYVDTEYCMRLQLEGFAVIRANRAILSHSEGQIAPRRFFGSVVHPTNHSPVRFYYRMRNRRYVRRLYRNKFPAHFRLESKIYWRTILKMLLFESQRWRKSTMMVRGFLASLRNDFQNISMS